MSKAIDLIHSSLFLIGAHSELKPVSPEMLTFSFKKLQTFIKALKDEDYSKIGIVVPYALADECSERGGATSRIEALFAVDVAPFFRIQPAPDVIAKAAEAQQYLDRYGKEIIIPNLTDRRYAFKGQGN